MLQAAAHQRVRTFPLTNVAPAGWPKRKAEKEAPLSVCGHQQQSEIQQQELQKDTKTQRKVTAKKLI